MAKRKPAEPKATSTKSKPVSKDNAPEVPSDLVKNEFGVIPPQTGQTEHVSSSNPKTENNEKTDTQGTQDANQSPQSTDQDGEKNGGDVAIESVSSSSVWPDAVESVPRARLTNEKRHAYWERMRKAARLAGLPRGQGPESAYVWATQQAELEFPYVPPPDPEIVEDLPDEGDFPTVGRSPEAPSAPIQADQGVSGLGNFPPDWPKLPANAQLQQEIAWVTANRLLVRDGSGVNLSRAMSPPPSYSALSWLETSILFPAKFADISVKATAENDDEKEFVRREKLAVEEIRSILKEMLDAKT